MDEKKITKFWNRVKRGAPHECWEWQGSRLPAGYGRINTRDIGNTYAHRVAYMITHGAIPQGMHVCHTCDNPPCCNPAHLWLGTQMENIQDRDRKGRTRSGENQPTTPLPTSIVTVEQIRALRQRYAAGGISMASLAKEFGISPTSAQRIIRRQQWPEV